MEISTDISTVVNIEIFKYYKFYEYYLFHLKNGEELLANSLTSALVTK